MLTLVYYYLIEKQFTNLFQLLNQTANIEFLAIKLVAYLMINRFDLAQNALNQMKKIEEDSVLVVVGQCWLSLHDPKTPLQSYENMISSLNELS